MSWPRRLAVRFAGIYLFLYALPFPLGFPGSERAAEAIAAVKRAPIPWIARTLGVGLPERVQSSGDSTFTWIEVPTCAVIALVAAFATLAVTQRRPHDQAWETTTATLLRYFVAASMLAYGAVKVLKSQFPALEPSDLQTTYGESSPMGLLWRMMSLSTGYTVFSGSIEVVGALLLYFRRTTLLGALLLSVALVQVVALNLAFDVPVKLGSIHLLLFTLLLLLPHGRRLVLFLSGETSPGHVPAGIAQGASRRRQRALLLVKGVIVIGTLLAVGIDAVRAYRTWGDGKPAEPLTALYDVVSMDVEGMTSCRGQWTRVTIDRNGFVVFGGRGAQLGLDHAYDPAVRSLVVSGENTRLASAPGTVGAHPEEIELEGTVGGHPAKLSLRRVPNEDLLLLGRGFHWVTDVAMHR